MGFGCARREGTPISISKIREFLNELRANDKNVPFTFLLVLDDEAFEKPCPLFPSLKNRINKRIKYYKLRIEKYSNLSNFEYSIEGTPEINKLYIMLPKEKVFIDPKDYDSRLLSSKTEELTEIFMNLGAYEIETTTINKIYNSEDTSVGTNVNVNNVDVGIEGAVTNINSNTHEVKEHLTFPKTDDYKLEIIKLLEYYYLPENSKWKNFIIRRVDGLLESLKYELENTEENQITKKIVEKLKFFDISVSYNNEHFVTSKKIYDVKFNKLKKENIFYEKEEENIET